VHLSLSPQLGTHACMSKHNSMLSTAYKPSVHMHPALCHITDMQRTLGKVYRLSPPPSAVLQIARRRRAHQEAHPDAQIISLGIGDTTEPLPQFIADAMAKAAAGLATREGYSG
jgi:predicted component of type VI protein secretion system